MIFLDYIKGLRKGKGARRIELESMYDPFLEEAIEGYDSVKGDHAKKILEMQGMISKRAGSKKRKYILSVASSAAVLIISYFSVFYHLDKPHEVWADADRNANELYVYVPQEYVEKIQAEEIEVSPVVEIDNINELLESVDGIEIYVPEEYLERERAKASNGEVQEKDAATTIINLDEILEPEKPINIYAPENYLKKKNLRT